MECRQFSFSGKKIYKRETNNELLKVDLTDVDEGLVLVMVMDGGCVTIHFIITP